jgi:hypothetical protein
MDANVQELLEWNAVFLLMGGSVVCSGCMIAQPVMAAGEPFPHEGGYKHDDDFTQHPWITLYQILDRNHGRAQGIPRH